VEARSRAVPVSTKFHERIPKAGRASIMISKSATLIGRTRDWSGVDSGSRNAVLQLVQVQVADFKKKVSYNCETMGANGIQSGMPCDTNPNI
jgi:hypothetical protein